MNKILKRVSAIALGLGMVASLGLCLKSKESYVAHAAGEANVGDTLWSEDFSGFSSGNVPSSSNSKTVVYGDKSLTYSITNTTTSAGKIYNENTAGGTAPELLVSKSGGTFSASGIPTGTAKTMSLTFVSNKTLTITSSSDAYSVSLNEDGEYIFTQVSGKTIPETFGITFKTSNSSNARLDNILLTVKESGAVKEVKGISVKTAPTKTSYVSGEKFNAGGLVLTVSYGDSTSQDVMFEGNESDFSFSPETITSSGNVTITYGGKTCTQAVSLVTLNSVTVEGTLGTQYVGKAWNASGLTVTAHYSDSKSVDVTSEALLAFSPETIQNTSIKSVAVTATYGGVSSEPTNFAVTVKDAPIETSVTFDLSVSTQVTSNSTEKVIFTEGIVSLVIEKNKATTNANNYLGQGNNGTRIYNGTKLTLTADGNTIKEVLINKSVNGNNAVGNIGVDGITGGTGVSGLGVITITGAANSTEISVLSAGKADIGSIVITYEAPYVATTGISLSKESIVMTNYDEERLVAEVLPINATNRSFAFSDYDTSLISIDEKGNITTLGKFGSTIVKAVAEDGGWTKTCSIVIERASFKEAKYTYTAKNQVTGSGDIDGLTATYASDGEKFGTADHLSLGSATLTISGLEGYKVESVLFKIKSLAESGSASLIVSAGSTVIKQINDASFDSDSWYGAYAPENIILKIAMSNQDYAIGNNEDLVVDFTSSVDGFHITDIRVRYTLAEVDNTAVTFAQKLLDELTCDGGVTAPSTTKWAELKGIYEDGSSVTEAAKQILFEAAAADHDYNSETDTSDAQIIAAAMARYDLVVGKYGYDDFINREPVYPARPSIIPNANNSNAIWIIVAVSLVSVSALGCLIYIRKSKKALTK